MENKFSSLTIHHLSFTIKKMDFEFDKEIDILLRQARSGETVFTATTPQSAHLDADEISAFAENALPEKAKQIYTAHLADCDSCRKSLSNLIFLNAENESKVVVSPENIVVASPTIPWYRKLFALPNLAYMMGAFVVLFGGIIGFMVLQNFNNSQNAEVAKINEKPQNIEQVPSESVSEIPESYNLVNANVAANINGGTTYSSNSMMSNAPLNSNMSVAPSKPVPSLADPKKEEPNREKDLAALSKESNNFSVKDAEENQVNKDFIQGGTAGRRNQRSQDDPRNSTPQISVSPASPANNRQLSELPVNNRQNDALLSSPAAKSESKKAKTSGAIENEKTIVSGKTFNRQNNVWYDASYNQQSTINITRGTEIYKKLDKELRAIVEKLGGTVVIVWKDKAYRIQ